MFLLPDVRLWDFAPWVRSVASSAWECRGSDQSGWNLVGKNAADDEWRFEAATFRACIYIWSRCPNSDRQLWMSLPTAARMTHCRPDCILPTQRPTVTEFLNVLFPSVFAQIIFWKVTMVTLHLGLWILGNSYFHSRIISWGQMWCFFLQVSWTGYILVKNFKKLILTFWRVGFDSIDFQTSNFNWQENLMHAVKLNYFTFCCSSIFTQKRGDEWSPQSRLVQHQSCQHRHRHWLITHFCPTPQR